jgi:hypothetical protein
MLQSGRMSQIHDQEVVFMSCSSQTEWVKFLTRKIYSCHAPVRQDESNPWPGSCIHVMLQSDRMSQVLEQEVVFMSFLSQVGWIKFMTRKLYSCHAPLRQDESSSWPGSCIHVILESGRMNKVHVQEDVFMSCSSQTEWVKFINRKLHSCHAPVRQDESSSWTGSCIHAMLQSGRMSQVHEHRKLYSCYAPVRQDESSSWPGMLILDWWPWHCVQMVNRVKIFIIYLTDSTFKYFIFHDYIAGKKWLNLILADFNLYLF